MGWTGYEEGGWLGAGINSGFLILVFVCVVLHELGHCLAARKCGIGVRQIILTPLGGMAQFARIPRKPSHELFITICGPAVNFVLAGILYGASYLVPEPYRLVHLFLYWLLVANLVMGLFNLIPAFPMDGGRIFRALLAYRLPYLKATQTAAITGQILSGIGIIVALFWLDHILLAVLFAFIFFAGRGEYALVRRQEQALEEWKQSLITPLIHRPPATEDAKKSIDAP